ncbi:MAG TPA: amidohydrolase family protein [Acidimicrobiales bacterium]|nr:amidohydrolase family protein [Acidimicrobiales bacterium]
MKVLGKGATPGRRQERGAVTLLPRPAARPVFCPVISVDDHLVEPPTLFEGRLPARLRDAAPRVVTDDDGLPRWLVDGERLPIGMPNALVGRPMEEWNVAPARFDEFLPGVTDPHERVADMEVAGIWASLPFPSMVWGFAGSRFAAMTDRELGLACLRAYNDWLLEEWCGAAPDRFIPCQVAWLADPDGAAAEVRRNAERGFRAVSFSENPEGQGMPSIHSGAWDPFFAACEETGTVVNLHVGSRGAITTGSTDSPVEVTVALFPVSGIVALTDWIFSRVPLRFPGIKVALSEGGASWVPMVVERLRRAYRQASASTHWSAADPDPVDVMHRNFSFTSIEDPTAFQHLDVIGAGNVMVEVDYPHGDSSWPDTQALLAAQLAHLPPDDVARVCFANAAALYHHPAPPPDRIERSEIGPALTAAGPGR